MKKLSIIAACILFVGFFEGRALFGKQPSTSHEMKSTLTLEEIAAIVNVADAKKIASERNIAFSIQNNETMKAQRLPEFDRSISFGGIARLWLTFWLQDDKATVHVTLFYNKNEVIVGRQIEIEDNNQP